jgi:hypothetical protein
MDAGHVVARGRDPATGKTSEGERMHAGLTSATGRTRRRRSVTALVLVAGIAACAG